jgi:hypothetical protein
MLILSNILFANYFITRSNPFIKSLATLSLSIYCLNFNKLLAIQFLTYSIGDYLIEIPNNFNNCLICFGLGNSLKLYLNNCYSQSYFITLITIFSKNKLISYSVSHIFLIYYLRGNIFNSYVPFLISDIIIGLSMVYKIKYTEYITYPLYWMSNLMTIYTYENNLKT